MIRSWPKKPPTPPPATPPPAAWLYRVDRCDYPDGVLARTLRAAGDDGWELVSVNEARSLVSFQDYSGWILTFKKPAPQG